MGHDFPAKFKDKEGRDSVRGALAKEFKEMNQRGEWVIFRGKPRGLKHFRIKFF